MCCPSNKVIKSYSKRLLALGGLHEDRLRLTLQAMSPTNAKTVHKIPLLHIERNLDRLGLLPPAHAHRSQESGQITLHSVLLNKSKFLKAEHHAEIRKIEIPRQMVVETLSWRSRPKLYASLKNASRIMPVRRSLLALVGRKPTVVRDQLFPQKTPGSRL